MAQVQKKLVRDQICDAAMMLFATQGYEHTTIADVAKKANISVGNVYRYFKSKSDILKEVIPTDFVSQVREQLVRKLETGSEGTNSIQEQMQEEAYRENSEHFLDYMIENRLRFMTLVKCKNIEDYKDFRQDILDSLVQIFTNKFILNETKREELYTTIFLLYNNFIDLCTEVLTIECSNETKKKQLRNLIRYHVTGLTSLVKE